MYMFAFLFFNIFLLMPLYDKDLRQDELYNQPSNTLNDGVVNCLFLEFQKEVKMIMVLIILSRFCAKCPQALKLHDKNELPYL